MEMATLLQMHPVAASVRRWKSCGAPTSSTLLSPPRSGDLRSPKCGKNPNAHNLTRIAASLIICATDVISAPRRKSVPNPPAAALPSFASFAPHAQGLGEGLDDKIRAYRPHHRLRPPAARPRPHPEDPRAARGASDLGVIPGQRPVKVRSCEMTFKEDSRE
jgi:hypothetical protein